MHFKLLILKYYFLSYIKNIFLQPEECKAQVWIECEYHLIRFFIIQTIQVRETGRGSSSQGPATSRGLMELEEVQDA